MRFTRFPSLLLLLAAGGLAGCGQNHLADPVSATPGTGSGSDEALVVSTLAGQPQVVEDGLAESAEATTLDSPTGTAAAIDPLTYWRRITDVQRAFEVAFADTDASGRPTTAVVALRKRLSGTFNILAGAPAEAGLPPDTAFVVHKPLEDHWVRRVLLKRLPLAAGGTDPLWRIVATSGVQITAREAATRILRLRIQCASLDTTITDPLAFHRLRRILRLAPESLVTLTATTGANDDVVVLQHADRRLRFRNNGDATYTGVWRSGPFAPGVRHFGVNALAHGTLFDDAAPYDSQSWLFPYVLEPERLAESMP